MMSRLTNIYDVQKYYPIALKAAELTTGKRTMAYKANKQAS
jgi:hypothetical protein